MNRILKLLEAWEARPPKVEPDNQDHLIFVFGRLLPALRDAIVDIKAANQSATTIEQLIRVASDGDGVAVHRPPGEPAKFYASHCSMDSDVPSVATGPTLEVSVAALVTILDQKKAHKLSPSNVPPPSRARAHDNGIRAVDLTDRTGGAENNKSGISGKSVIVGGTPVEILAAHTASAPQRKRASRKKPASVPPAEPQKTDGNATA